MNEQDNKIARRAIDLNRKLYESMGDEPGLGGPVEAFAFTCAWDWPTVSVAADACCTGAVLDGNEVALFGKRKNIDATMRLLTEVEGRRWAQQTVEWVRYITETINDGGHTLTRWRNRANPLMLMHRIAEVYPDLRVPSATREIALLPEAGELKLGGCAGWNFLDETWEAIAAIERRGGLLLNCYGEWAPGFVIVAGPLRDAMLYIQPTTGDKLEHIIQQLAPVCWDQLQYEDLPEWPAGTVGVWVEDWWASKQARPK